MDVYSAAKSVDGRFKWNCNEYS